MAGTTRTATRRGVLGADSSDETRDSSCSCRVCPRARARLRLELRHSIYSVSEHTSIRECLEVTDSRSFSRCQGRRICPLLRNHWGFLVDTRLHPSGGMTFTVTRSTADRFSVTSNIPLSDGTMQADTAMCLQGQTLRVAVSKGDIRIRQFCVKLGPIALAKVSALAIGETVQL